MNSDRLRNITVHVMPDRFASKIVAGGITQKNGMRIAYWGWTMQCCNSENSESALAGIATEVG